MTRLRIEVGAYFNPRSHERSDHKAPILYIQEPDFNPRSHERSDQTCTRTRSDCSISIHAPTRGATSVSMSMSQPYEFQSTLPREERHIAHCQQVFR